MRCEIESESCLWAVWGLLAVCALFFAHMADRLRRSLGLSWLPFLRSGDPNGIGWLGLTGLTLGLVLHTMGGYLTTSFYALTLVPGQPAVLDYPFPYRDRAVELASLAEVRAVQVDNHKLGEAHVSGFEVELLLKDGTALTSARMSEHRDPQPLLRALQDWWGKPPIPHQRDSAEGPSRPTVPRQGRPENP